MAYRASGTSERDQIYPSEVAAQRPALATKVDCSGDYYESDPAHSIRGVKQEPMPSIEEHEEDESAVARFNRQLRGE